MDRSGRVELPSEALAALARGSKIDAIKEVRAKRGMDLKGSKDLVDHYLLSHPELQRKLDESSAAASRSFLRALIILALLGALAYFGMERFG